MGIATIAVFSEADRDALHVSLADESYCIGGAAVSDSYLNIGAILTVASYCNAEAIHPGYGLLSENAEFAGLCAECGILFIGPDADTITKMGDKDEARRTVKTAGVPIIPGTDIIGDVDTGLEQADAIGYPVMLKARAGGGGRGIRIITVPDDFTQSYDSAVMEAKKAFGDGAVYMEKYLYPVKHVEVQIICDNHGNRVCLGDRDCSIQRKNQKLLEECPACISDDMRISMRADALKIAEAVNYRGVGTIEFLVTGDGSYYFMEMNTRLQVEHSVTEMATGIDIVKWQIRIAADYTIDINNELNKNGHAIECRIIAENPMQNFRPNCGEVTLLHIPGGHFVRFDTALYQNYFIPPYYDSMIGKLIVGAGTREEAIRKMRGALSELVIEGIYHNSELQIEILSDDEFVSGEYTTDFLIRKGYVSDR